jgi:hypothetical protein
LFAAFLFAGIVGCIRLGWRSGRKSLQSLGEDCQAAIVSLSVYLVLDIEYPRLALGQDQFFGPANYRVAQEHETLPSHRPGTVLREP